MMSDLGDDEGPPELIVVGNESGVPGQTPTKKVPITIITGTVVPVPTDE